MKNLIIISFLLLLGGYGYSQDAQEVVGTWIKEPYQKKGLKLTENGEFILFQVGKEDEITDRDKFQYKTAVEDGVKYIIVFVSRGKEEIEIMKNKYKVEENKLFLPVTQTENGVTTVKDFADIYIRK